MSHFVFSQAYFETLPNIYDVIFFAKMVKAYALCLRGVYYSLFTVFYWFFFWLALISSQKWILWLFYSNVFFVVTYYRLKIDGELITIIIAPLEIAALMVSTNNWKQQEYRNKIHREFKNIRYRGLLEIGREWLRYLLFPKTRKFYIWDRTSVI